MQSKYYEKAYANLTEGHYRMGSEESCLLDYLKVIAKHFPKFEAD